MKYTKTQLSSGIRLITVPLEGTRSVTVLVMVGAGSAFETKPTRGISHFLEHMLFKGTPRRPTTLAIAEELDGIGGEYNAFTGKEWTGYFAKAHRRHLPLLLDIISDIFLNALISEEEIERERLVILEEMNMYQDTPIKYVDDLIEELLYGDQPQGWKVIGEKETVSLLNQKDLKNYFRARYRSEETAVIIAGDFNEKRIYAEVDTYFGGMPRLGATDKRAVVEKQARHAVKIRAKDTDQTHLTVAFRAYHASHENLPTLHVLNILLGGNMSSRLFINIREREGLCYYINSHVEAYSDCGYLAIKTGVDNKRAVRAIELIMLELQALREKKVKSAELQKVKEYVRGKLALTLETSNEVAFWVGGQEMTTGKIKTPREIMKEVEGVTPASLQRVAEEIIKGSGLNLVAISPRRQKTFEQALRL